MACSSRTVSLPDPAGNGAISAWVIDPKTVGIVVDTSGVSIRVRVADDYGVLHLSPVEWDAFVDAVADRIVEVFELDAGDD